MNKGSQNLRQTLGDHSAFFQDTTRMLTNAAINDHVDCTVFFAKTAGAC